MSLLSLLALLAGAEPPRPLGHVPVVDEKATPFCQNAQHLRSTEDLCARKPTVTTTHWRQTEKQKDPTFTVRLDVLSFATHQDALHARQDLIALAGTLEVNGQLTLAWCPRSYVWSGDELMVVSTRCGGERPMCALIRALVGTAPDAGNSEPWGILGFEGGSTVLGLGAASFARCK